MSDDSEQISERQARARGCMLGQLAGDSLGSLVEFQAPGQIRSRYPEGVRHLHDGGTFNTLAGQPTDDSEMALGLARYLVRTRAYVQDEVRQVYLDWLHSAPFDCGNTISSGLRGRRDYASQANGALMRISPLGIWAAGLDSADKVDCAILDAELTHPHPVCLQINRLFVAAIRRAIRKKTEAGELYQWLAEQAVRDDVDGAVLAVIRAAEQQKPEDYLRHQGWVLIAFQNALWQLLHAESLEDAVVDTVMCGGDTDTNAAICGALLGALHGERAIPPRWRQVLAKCCPEEGRPGVFRPRPEVYWPVDAEELAVQLLAAHGEG